MDSNSKSYITFQQHETKPTKLTTNYKLRKDIPIPIIAIRACVFISPGQSDKLNNRKFTSQLSENGDDKKIYNPGSWL